jgi:hypothetical protein
LPRRLERLVANTTLATAETKGGHGRKS